VESKHAKIGPNDPVPEHRWLNRRMALTHTVAVLELIFNLLHACEMVDRAEALVAESGATFRLSPQSWERTVLQLLIGGSVREGRSVWACPEENDEYCSAVSMERDLVRPPYLEKRPEILDALEHSDRHILWDPGGRRRWTNVRACSLPSLVIFFALPDGGNEEDRDMLLLLMPCITTGAHFIEYLAAFFHLDINESHLSHHANDDTVFSMMYQRIVNFMKSWLDYAPSRRTLLAINEFLDGLTGDSRIQGIEKAIESMKTRVSGLLRGRASGHLVRSKSKITGPPPLITPHQLPFMFNPNLKIFDLYPIGVQGILRSSSRRNTFKLE
jgi:hypothetical protein